jgi:hypothetical protein
MGCWLEMHDASSQAHVRIHGHAFFVPKTAPGHTARVQARLVGGAEEECAEHGEKKPGLARVELEATGVEID